MVQNHLDIHVVVIHVGKLFEKHVNQITLFHVKTYEGYQHTNFSHVC